MAAGRNPNRRKQDGKWKIEKTISLGHIISTLIFIAALLAGYNKLTNRIAILETSNQTNSNELLILREQIRDDYRDIITRLDNLYDRLAR